MKKIVLIHLIFFVNLFAQDSTVSLAFKSTKPERRGPIFYQPNLSYQLLQNFKIQQSANAGDALAQHELGLRYLLGKDIPADTAEAAYWIKKAAGQQLAAACYNYGILLFNGWGVNWNPFEAFKQFSIAAEAGMDQAEYIIGVMYLENLVVNKDVSKAKYWLLRAAETNNDAVKVLAEVDEKFSEIDSVSNANKNISESSSLGLVYINFDALKDTLIKAGEETLIKDLKNPGNENLISELFVDNDSIKILTASQLQKILEFADAGSPEALTYTGYLYENGKFLNKDLIKAAAYYLRAMRLDSPRSPLLLWEIINQGGFVQQLNSKAKNNDEEAMFVLYGLHNSGFYSEITGNDAIEFLRKSAAQNFIPAINELGLIYYTGKYIQQDKQKAFLHWQLAKQNGSKEAEARLLTEKFYSGNFNLYDVKELKTLAENGSLLAQVVLAHCYEQGIGLQKSAAEAVNLYRGAAQRGSKFAMEELKRLYNDIRPSEALFKIN